MIKGIHNTKNIEGVDFITSTSEENYKASNRQGVVVSTPIGLQRRY